MKTPTIEAYRDERVKNLFVIPIAIDQASVWRIENWEEIFQNLTEAVRKNIVKNSIDVVVLDMYQLSRITPIETFGLDKADLIVLVVEGYEDCTKPITIIKTGRIFATRVEKSYPLQVDRIGYHGIYTV
ncbi:hypothetical protein [Pyrobaculum aerophilum]|uniref:hypothetical protein n=1 Tax=Pyrobaculum aerophilum TaxID=13773 RepID=UPI0021623D55|nr:hypothetical protein [Pyrobaculum aerophilum]